MLEELKSSSIKISSAGLGGVCVPALKITYERNSTEYYIYYYSFFAMSSNDGNVYKIIDKNITNNVSGSSSCIYEINSLGNTLDTIKKKFDL